MLHRVLHAVVLIAVMGLPAMARQSDKRAPETAPAPCPEQKLFLMPFDGSRLAPPNLQYYGLEFADPTALGSLGSYYEQHSDAGFMGVVLGTLSDTRAKELGLDKMTGAYVQRVVKGGPAERAGVKDGDVVVSIDGKSVQSSEAFREILGGMKPEQNVRVELLRDGNRQTISVTLGSRPNLSEFFGRGWNGEMYKDALRGWPIGNRARLGVSLVELTDQLREHFGVDEGKGVLVASVEAGSAAAKSGVKAGDVIVSIGTVDVTSVGDIVRELHKLQPGTTTLDVGIIRDRSRQSIDVSIDVPDKREKPGFGHYRT
jgi:S1-C subfamily serine protease